MHCIQKLTDPLARWSQLHKEHENIKNMFKNWNLEMCATYSKLSEATQIDEFTHIKKKKEKRALNVSASGFSAGDSHT